MRRLIAVKIKKNGRSNWLASPGGNGVFLQIDYEQKKTGVNPVKTRLVQLETPPNFTTSKKNGHSEEWPIV